MFYQKTTLDNGLRIVTSAMPHTRSVSINIFIGAGSRYEPGTEAGISHFIEHICFKGTQRRTTAREISTAIEGVGGILNGSTDKELTLYWCKVTQPNFSLALDVLVDIIRNSKFDPQDIEKERQIIIEEIHLSNDSPQQRVDMLIDELLWPRHPLGRDIAGSKETVAAITKEAMLGFLATEYQPRNMIVAVAGNIQHHEVVNTVSQVMGSLNNTRQLLEYSPYEPRASKRLHIETKDTEQVHLCLGIPGLSLFHPKRFTLDLINVILGVGMSSRLFTQIRDRLGLAYSIHSYVEHFLDTGSMTIYAGIEPPNLGVAIKAILEELAHLKEPIPEGEIAKAKEQVKGLLLLSMEDTRNVAGWLGGQETLTGHIYSLDEVVSFINAITAGDIRQLAQELLVSSQLRLAAVGPVASDAPLEELLRL